MRSNQELAAEALRRARALTARRARRMQTGVLSFAGLASLAAIGALATRLGSVSSALPRRGVVPGTLGAMFLKSEALGHVVIGVVAFLLGVGVTLLAFLMRRHSPENNRQDAP